MTTEHAVAEKLQHLRNRVLHDQFLFEHGRRLAICPVEIDSELGLADLCDPRHLLERGVAPDRLASSDRSVTQGIAQRLYEDVDLAGFRWWSALSGDWHTTVLFSDRIPPGGGLEFSASTYLYLDSEPVATATVALGIEIARE